MEDKTMKKIFTRLFAVSAIFAAFSCAELDAPTVSPEEGQTPETDPNGEYTTLTITPVATKSYLNGGELEWSGNDFIYVFDDEGNRFKFTGEAKAAASFKFTYDNWPVGAEPVYAVFCPDGDPTWVSEGKFQMTHPDSQPIHNGNSFGKKANTSVAKIEKTQEGAYTAEFKNVCGLLKFVVATDYVKTVRIESIDGTPIAGDIVVNYNEGEPTYVMAEGGKKATSISVTPKANTSSTYYACLLPCDLDGIEVTVTNINGRSMSLSGSALMTINRNGHVNLGTLDQCTIDMQFTGENRYGLPTSDTDVKGLTYTIKDSFGMPQEFVINQCYKYKHDSSTGLTLARDTSNKGNNKNHIGLPVYESMYISYLKVALVNTSSKYMYLYTQTSEDGFNYPESLPVAGRLNPSAGAPKAWNMGEGEAVYTENVQNEDSSYAKTSNVTPDLAKVITPNTQRNTRYWLTFHGDPVQVDYVQLTYTFSSEGPDASETPETSVE